MSAALIISLIIFLAVLYSGLHNGLFSSVGTLFMLTIAIGFAISFYGPVGSLGVLERMGDYARPLCLLAIFIISYFALQLLATVLAPSTVRMKPLVNKMGGLGVGLLNAVLTTGFLGIVFYMMPWTGVHKGTGAFLTTDLGVGAVGQLTATSGGTRLDSKTLFDQLKQAESQRRCYRNMMRVYGVLKDIHDEWERFSPIKESTIHNALLNGTNLPSEGASRGKGVGANGIICPQSDSEYVVRLLQARDVPYMAKGKAIQAYDASPSHSIDGKPARMVLLVYRKTGGALDGEVVLMPEEEFAKQLNPQP